MSGSRNSYGRHARATATVQKPMTDKEFDKMQAEFDPLAMEVLLLGKGQKRNAEDKESKRDDDFSLKFRRTNTTRTRAGGRGGGGRGGGGRGRGGRGPNAGSIAGRGSGAEQSVKKFKKMSSELIEFVKKAKAYTFYAFTAVQGNLLDMAYDDGLFQDEALYGLSKVGLGPNGALGPRIAGKNAETLSTLADA